MTQKQVEAAIAATDTVHAQHGTTLKANADWGKVKTQWQALKAQSVTEQNAAAAEELCATAEEVGALSENVAETIFAQTDTLRRVTDSIASLFTHAQSLAEATHAFQLGEEEDEAETAPVPNVYSSWRKAA